MAPDADGGGAVFLCTEVRIDHESLYVGSPLGDPFTDPAARWRAGCCSLLGLAAGAGSACRRTLAIGEAGGSHHSLLSQPHGIAGYLGDPQERRDGDALSARLCG